jgi:CheY-like chemotaxis protein
MLFNPLNNHRILLIDDNPAIHEDFRKILCPPSDLADLDKREAALFGDTKIISKLPVFEIDSAYQGGEGLEFIKKSLPEERPYALAFVDVRMPPGWDGVQTTCEIWRGYPDLQVVLCSAYFDYSWEEMVRSLGYLERLVVLKKPFDNIEVMQLAVGMTKKWRLNQMTKLQVDNLEHLVKVATCSTRSNSI